MLRHEKMTRSAPAAIETWRALVAPRRSVPLMLVLGAMLAAEWAATRSLGWLAIESALFTAFCLVGPHAWRVGCSRRSGTALAVGTIGYVLAIGALVALIGALLPSAFVLPYSYVLDPAALPLVAVLLAVAGWGLGRDVELEAGIEAERDRAGKLAIEAERAELLALRANLDPHFLFNTLNAIAEWCREDPEIAEKATLELASMLRAMLEGIRAPSWPLATELSLARALLELHAIRDRARYAFRIDAPDPVPDVRVPPMLLLPLVENALTHGPGAGHDGEIALSLRVDADRVLVEIENPGTYRGRREGGEGIAMVERRLALAYGTYARLELESDGARTKTRLSMPRAIAEELA